MASPLDLTNRSDAQQTSVAVPSFLPLLPGLTELSSPAGFASADANCLQAVTGTLAKPASRDSARAGVRCAPRQEAIPFCRLAKRVLDLFVSSVTLLLLWPLMLLIAIAVRLDSQGPVIYPSWRVGKNGIPFPCYKFRTMVPGADGLRQELIHLNQRRGPFFKIANDPRVTRLGPFLRKYSLDELPQLWNVLKGDMSLVGPRPHPLEDVKQYGSGHEQRLEVKPGITGLWQVTARQDPSFETCMKLDLEYMKRWSLALDCKILVRTVPAVLAGEGQ